MSILYMINLTSSKNFKEKLMYFPSKSTHFRIHKNQVGLMKLKAFSPQGVKIKQFLFIKRLPYIKRFLQQY